MDPAPLLPAAGAGELELVTGLISVGRPEHGPISRGSRQKMRTPNRAVPLAPPGFERSSSVLSSVSSSSASPAVTQMSSHPAIVVLL